MRLRPGRILHGMHLALLRFVSLLVPLQQRAEWRQEWRSELWHVRDARTPARGVSLSAELEVAAFCLGAFQDAICLKRHYRPSRVPLATTMGSAPQCILFLAMLGLLSYGLGLLVPGVQLQSAQYRDARNLLLIQDARSLDDSVPTIQTEQFLRWKRKRQVVFDEFAFYRVDLESVADLDSVPSGSHTPMRWGIAHASLNLLDLLGLSARLPPVQEDARGLPQVILSDALWTLQFRRDPRLIGHAVLVGSTQAVVAGVVPASAWKLPGDVSAWLLQPDPVLPPESRGFVLAHLKPSAEHSRLGERWHISAPGADGEAGDFLCVSVIERTQGPWGVYWFTIFLACLALPATTSLPLGEYRVNSSRLPWSTRLRRWSFLSCKIALLLPLVYFASLDLAHLRSSFSPESSEYIQIVSSFSICLFGLRWTLRDQRQRCPVCLGKLTHPARVGQPSRNFLGWNGLELICISGHGLLHVPEIQTSWFSTQRWLYLDSSWDVLFAEPGLRSSGYL